MTTNTSNLIQNLSKPTDNTLSMILLNFISFGMYNAFYLKSQSEVVNEYVTEYNKISKTLMNSVILTSVLHLYMVMVDFFGGLSSSLIVIDNLVTLSYLITMTVLSFAVRNRFNTLIDAEGGYVPKMNGFFVFLFGAFYINYKIRSINNSFLRVGE